MSHISNITKDDTFKTWRLNHNELVDLLNTSLVGSPTPVLINTVMDMVNYVESAGVFSGCSVTDNGDGSVAVATGEAMLRVGANVGDAIAIGTVPASPTLALVDQDINYIYVDYNVASPIIVATIDANDFNGHDKCIIALVSREGLDLTILEAQEKPVDNSNRINTMMIDTHGIHHVLGGTQMSEPAALKLAITSGAFYRGLKKTTHVAFDSNVADTFETYYSDGASGHTTVAAQTSIDNVNYDNGTGTLANVTAGNYGIHWVYMKLGSNQQEIYVLYGIGDYATVSDARVEVAPAELPAQLGDMGVLIGRVIVQRDAVNLDSIESAFGATFQAGSPSDHENLSNLQGGAPGDHFHLTSVEQSTLTGHASATDNPHGVTAIQAGADPEGEAVAMAIALG